ncbi:LRR receptor-like serine/threonine-protein kinase FLS2 [Canna indica]|uniref:LRR receptor-like serine/threonine-protein kinase FLS2 n=1 Tax=Canna indica TaxID=4628 RepID=A0AAQ3JPU4_9LILI|nr:LRR receptor-like serine/threonine-protein kinase FLS2 [Canna indica]
MAARSSTKLYGFVSSKHVPVILTVFLLSLGATPCCRSLEADRTTRCVETERRALLAIKSDMYDPGDWFSSWTGRDCCTWRGVACDDNATGGHVTELNLRYPYADDQYGFSTKGASKVNPSLLQLKHLKRLDLSMNDFAGARIPKMIASLVHLKYLNLSNAGFGGSIPPQLGNLSSLRHLDLGGCSNKLRADDLEWLSRIPSLMYLDMYCLNLSEATNWLHQVNSIATLRVLCLGQASLPNVPPPFPPFNLTSISKIDLSAYHNLTSTMWRWLSNASSLEYLYLDSCLFNLDVEVVQVALAALSKLKELNLANNDITGEISAVVRNISRRLKHLDLSNNSLSGEIPPSMGDLLLLEHLDLEHNNIIGEIPRSVGNLTNLVKLYLTKNNISGEIPKNIGNLLSLQVLNLDRNQLTGQIPENIEKLQNLTELSLDDNSITGQIPATIGILYNLEILSMPSNYLTGEIPRSLGDLCKLIVLDLSYNDIVGEVTDLIDGLSNCSEGTPLNTMYMENNNLSGIIPPSLGQFSEMEDLDLSLNSLEGNITQAHFSNLTYLLYFDISFNSLNVILPNDWIPPFSASDISMGNCHFGTKFPAWIRTQTNLLGLHLSRAGLSGNVPAWFWDLSRGLINLNLSSNHLSGVLPPSAFLSSTQLTTLDLSNNSFQGPIPVSLADAIELQLLTLSNNHFNGNLPSSFCNMSKLEVLDLSNNNLSGNVPDCHTSFPASLESLHLNNNSFSGRFPSLLYCEELVLLDLGDNTFSGEIPTWIGEALLSLRVLRLRSNLFYGTIPASVSNLTSLQVLDLSSNNLFGRIPSSLGYLSAMRIIQNNSAPLNFFYSESVEIIAKGSSFEYTTVLSLVTSLDLSGNNLSGEIPKELTNLLGLRFLSLSNNHLTGRIPEKIGVMTQLESLDLSLNNFSGGIPSSLSSLHFLSHLNVSYNNLSGRIPTGSQFLTFNDPSIYVGNKDLCGLPLRECPSDAAIAEDEESDSDKLETVFLITSIIIGFVVGFWLSAGTLIIKHSIRIALFRWMDKICDWIYVHCAVKYAKLKSKLQGRPKN